MPVFIPPALEFVFLRIVGIACGFSPASLAAAAIAAILATFVDTLFRRVTRCVALADPEDIECEWCRLWVDREGREPDVIESLCWPRGLEECWVSWVKQLISATCTPGVVGDSSAVPLKKSY